MCSRTGAEVCGREAGVAYIFGNHKRRRSDGGGSAHGRHAGIYIEIVNGTNVSEWRVTWPTVTTTTTSTGDDGDGDDNDVGDAHVLRLRMGGFARAAAAEALINLHAYAQACVCVRARAQTRTVTGECG